MESFDAIRRGRRRHLVKLLAITLAFLLVVGVPLVLFAVRRFERAVIFHPVAYDGGPTWRPPRGGEDVWLTTVSGARLHGWFVKTPLSPPAATVIYLHGNGGNLSHTGWLADELSARGFDVLLFDYKGYGRSEGVSVDERSINEDADAAYDYIVKERGVAPERLVLYGQSLGTTAAVDVATRKACAALVLESGLSSASDMGALVLPVLPRFLHRLGRNRFESTRKLAGVSVPVLVAHGDRDEVIPVEQGRALYAAAPGAKRLIVVPGAGHNDLVATGGPRYLDSVAEFIRSAVSSKSL